MPPIVLSISAFRYAWYMSIGRVQLCTETEEKLHFILEFI